MINEELENVKVHFEHWFVVCFLKPFGFIGIAIGSHIFLAFPKEQVSRRLLRHEACHALQWRAYGFFGFLRRYVGAFFKNYFSNGFKWMAAYYQIPLEIEARAAEKDPTFDLKI